jgi:hypothetical protein
MGDLMAFALLRCGLPQTLRDRLMLFDTAASPLLELSLNGFDRWDAIARFMYHWPTSL